MRYFKMSQDMNIRKSINGTKLGVIPKDAVISTEKLTTASNGTEWADTTYEGITGKIAVLPESKGYAKEVTDEYNKPVTPVEPTPSQKGLTRQKMVDQMVAWLGKNEKDGSHKEIVDIYNGHTPRARGYKMPYTAPWCATTVSAAAISCNLTDIVPIECSCGRMIELAQKMGIWQELDSITPAPGDIIMYDWDDNGKGDDKGWPEHVGVVEVVNGSTITVIEGNYKDAVGKRNIEVNGKNIRGYVQPKYESKDVSTPVEIKPIVKPVEKPEVKPEEKPEVKPEETTSDVVYFKAYTGNSVSITDALVAIGENGSYTYRKTIAAINGIANYIGLAEQNGQMLRLLKMGKLIKSNAVTYYPKCTVQTVSIVTGLNSVNVDSSFAHRTKIAKANKINNYIGTAEQNTKMLNLLKEGLLIKA